MTNLAALDWADRFILAGSSIGVVFVILIALVAILGVFTFVAKKTNAKATEVKVKRQEKKETKTFEKASEEDKAAVAVALYLYYYEKNNRENRVLTIKPTPSAWHYELNERL